jgi:putative colanic acid biosynthesis glycosyltransferase
VTQVTVITVCYNAKSDLDITLESIRAQCYPNLHYLVIDGASTDGTKELLQLNADLIDDWISEPDRGIYDAMNKGIDRCDPNSWVIFLNAGDQFASTDVLQRLSSLLASPVDFIFGDVAIRTNEGVQVYPKRPHAYVEMPGCHQSTLIKASVLKKFQFDTRYKVGADFEFFLRATQEISRVAFFNGVIGEIAPEGFTAKNEALLRKDYVDILVRFRGYLAASRWLVGRILRTTYHKYVSVSKALAK